MIAILDYHTYRLASMAQALMGRMTGDQCHIVRISTKAHAFWRLVRYDASGKEADCGSKGQDGRVCAVASHFPCAGSGG